MQYDEKSSTTDLAKPSKSERNGQQASKPKPAPENDITQEKPNTTQPAKKKSDQLLKSAADEDPLSIFQPLQKKREKKEKGGKTNQFDFSM
jgi:hypothetical protein